MKKSVLIFLLSCVIQGAYSQSEIPGLFLGSAFGTSPMTVKFNLEQAGFHYDEELAEGAIAVSNVPFESFDFNSAVFLFNKQKFYLVNFFINLTDEKEAFVTYQDILQMLHETYGTYPKEEEEDAVTFHHLNRSVQLQWYVQPFSDGDPRYYISLAYYDDRLLPPDE